MVQPAKDGPMKCSSWRVGDVQFVIRGELRFKTDAKGRPTGTADVHTSPGQSWLVCDTCSAQFGVEGWRQDGSGEVMLVEADGSNDESGVELERESPPPGVD